MKTFEIRPATHERGSLFFHIWKADDGKYYSCRSGEYRGISSESDDLGPFDTEFEAYEAIKQDTLDYELNE